MRNFVIFPYQVEKDATRQRVQPGKLSTLRNATIQAMSNLLSANIDSGLMHSIGLGYHKDLQSRAAFIEVRAAFICSSFLELSASYYWQCLSFMIHACTIEH